MDIIREILKFFNTQWLDIGAPWEIPELFGVYHILCLVAMFAVAILLCFLWKKGVIKNPRTVILVTAIIVTVFEIYKQINFNVSYDPEVKFNDTYRWYAFPWQFCSTPLYVGLLAGLTNPQGRLHKYLCSYLATFALFAGLAVMIYPGDVFMPTVGICIQTVICHGSMVVVAIFLYYTGYVKTNIKTLFQALPIFSVTITIAIILNEITYAAGVGFNAFFLSRHHSSTLPVYSIVHNALMDISPAFYPLCLVIYILGFTLVAGLMLLIAAGIKKLGTYNFDAQYEEDDERRRVRKEEHRQKLLILEEKRKEALRKEREKAKAKKQAKKEKRDEKRAQKRALRKQRAEEREERRDERRTEEQRERARRKKERKERKKERKLREKEEAKARKKARKAEKKKERERELRLEKRMNEIKKREKKEKKEQQKALKKQKKLLKEQKKLAKKEEKAYRKWVKQQKKNGTYDPYNDPYLD